MNYKIIPFTADFIAQAKDFTDRQIGLDYYSVAEMTANQKKSIASTGDLTSFLLIDSKNNIQGIRLAYPAGNWAHGKGNKLRPDLWPFPIQKAGYFQSLFVSEEVRGQGWGPKLSEQTLRIFRMLGYRGVITHCWKESPENTSYKYLIDFGFKEIIEHPNYWIDIDYVCTRDGKPCRCTAIEMSFEL